MEYKKFVKKGRKVRYIHSRYNAWGNLIDQTEKVVTVLQSVPSDNYTGKFKSWDAFDGYFDTVAIQYENGEKESVSITDLYPYRTINELSYDELKKLYGEIRPGSIYLSDYENSFGVDKQIVSDMCDGYLECLYESYGEDSDAFLAADGFAEYCQGY